MPRRALTKALYAQILESFMAALTDNPGVIPNFRQVSRDANVSQAFAKKTFHLGWPKHAWAPPIEQVSHKDFEATKAALLADASTRQAHEKLRVDAVHRKMRNAVDVTEQERRLVSLIRSSSGALLSQVATLVRASKPLADRAASQLAKDKDLTSHEIVKLLGDITRHATRCAALVEQAVDLERKLNGEPTQRIAVQHDVAVPTVDEALAVLADRIGPARVIPVRQRISLRELRNAPDVDDPIPSPTGRGKVKGSMAHTTGAHRGSGAQQPQLREALHLAQVREDVLAAEEAEDG